MSSDKILWLAWFSTSWYSLRPCATLCSTAFSQRCAGRLPLQMATCTNPWPLITSEVSKHILAHKHAPLQMPVAHRRAPKRAPPLP